MSTITPEHSLQSIDDSFVERHVGPGPFERAEMLRALGLNSLDELIESAIPGPLRRTGAMELDHPVSEPQALAELRAIASRNVVARSYLGLGYHGTVTPPAIQRHILENPRWYTPYTPYQAEISQGRLEALLIFQTMIADLTGLPMAGASLLDEATAAAEAMAMAHAAGKSGRTAFYVCEDCHPQTIAVVKTRAAAFNWTVEVGPADAFDAEKQELFGVLFQYPASDGRVRDLAPLVERAHAGQALAIVAADLMALAVLRAPGEFGADIAVGSTQRFGMPMGYGGPHAAFLATRDEFKRSMPGRIVGVSVDAHGNRALRLALQTREQHIRREKATSNICTAQVLPAVVAAMYAVFHGPRRLRAIAQTIHRKALALAAGVGSLGYEIVHDQFFDTIRVNAGKRAESIIATAANHHINLRREGDGTVIIALDETVTAADLNELFVIFAQAAQMQAPHALDLLEDTDPSSAPSPRRESDYLTEPVFRKYHSETELMRFLHRLATRDVSLLDSMIPLGSCTMKLNAAAEMIPITWPRFSALHPYAPISQAKGYRQIFLDLERWLGGITGLPAVSLQPNAGSQGEYAGLMTIHAYHRSRGDHARDVCLIPTSAHGTNPASAAMAGFKVVPVAVDEKGNINLDDLRKRAAENRERLAAMMVTYPSTAGVFEAGVREACAIIHEHGGQVYLDGANMNALVGLVRPGELGADVCHLNLHKTFCIPHGGGGPGMGPICAGEHLAPFLPGHPITPVGGDQTCGTISAAPWGSALILPISWMYIRMMGEEGLTLATQTAILNANYMAARLKDHYKLVYTGQNDRCAHEFIIDLGPLKKTADIGPDDVAKRLMDFGFHAPTMSWPVPGTLMIEPTESESRAELDRFCDAMILIREEIRAIEEGRADKNDNPLKNAPHTAAIVTAEEWNHAYPRAQAAWPAAWLREHKFWPSVGRVDNAYGDRNLVCQCGAVDEYV